MNVIKKLSSATGKRSKEANKAFAKEIADNNNRKSIKELIELLDNKDRNIQSDSIEVLYETGYIKPDLIADYYKTFLELIENKNNRLVWGAMIALSSISIIIPELIYKELHKIVTVVNKGSVITKDAGVALYANLATVENQKQKVFPILLKELATCPSKQLPQYAEKSLIAIDEKNKKEFITLINSRISDLEKESQIKRIKKVLSDVEKV
jgi:succinate dehydrogenase flavin-adding protein (antitoxin of CptAB toxin-antitoxin module)